MRSRVVAGLIFCFGLCCIDVLGKAPKANLPFDEIFLLITSGDLGKAEGELEKYASDKKTETEYLLLKGLLSFSLFEFDQSMGHLNEAEKYIGSSVNPELNRARLNHFKGILFLKGFYKSEIAIDYLKEAEPVYAFQKVPSHYLADLYFQLGRCYKDLGDIGNAKYYILKSLDIYRDQGQRFPIQIADNLNTLGVIEVDLVQATKAMNLFVQAIELVQTQNKDHLLLSKIFDNQGFAFIMQGKEDGAVLAFRNSIAIARQYSYGRFWTSNSYLNLGEYFLNKNQIDSAIYYFKRCSHERALLFGPKNFETAQSFRHVGLAYRAKTHYDSALLYVEKALLPYGEWNKGELNDQGAESYLTTIDLISLKAQLLIDQYLVDSAKVQNLAIAHDLFNHVSHLSREWYKNFFWENSHGYIQDVMKTNYEKGIYTAYLLFRKYGDDVYANRALELMEGSKAQILLENLMISKVISDNPDAKEKRALELSLKRKLTAAQFLETSQRMSDPPNDKLIISLSDSLVLLYKELEKSDVNYYSSRFQTQFNLRENLHYLDQHKISLVEFFYGDDAIYSIVYDGKGVKDFHQVKRDKSLDLKLDSLLKLLSTLPAIADQRKQAFVYSQVSYSVFQKLLKIPLESVTTNQLIIIPDRVLFRLPFEALTLSHGGDETFSKLDYLQRHYVISYAYSLASLVKKKAESTSYTSASAFGYSGEEEKISKISSAQEINAIADILNFKIFLGNRATKEAIMESLQNDQNVHFALHGIASSIEGKSLVILPSGDTLFAYEIYETLVNSNLVHLNACETMAGPDNATEGAISLARAFIFSGASSVITNLWIQDDTHARILAIEFYRRLSDGMSVGESLTLAKRKIIEGGDQFTAHPYYWAGTILIGQPNNLTAKLKWYHWLVVIIIFSFVIGKIIRWNFTSRLNHKR